MPSRRSKAESRGISLRDSLLKAGLAPHLADLLDDMPHKVVWAEPKRTFREPGSAGDEVMFVRRGILSKFKTDTSGRRQIVALRFAGEGILPRSAPAEYGLQAIVSSEVMVGHAQDFDPIVDAHPDLRHFFRRLVERNEAIGYEWLVNCGRRDSTARVAHLLCETAVRMKAQKDTHLLNPFTQQQIAEITGQTSVNVNRVLAEMERRGLIRRTGREIAFTDWNEMRRVGGFQPGYLFSNPRASA